MTRPAAAATVLIDDARSRVTRFEFPSGAETGWHVHGLPYVIVALTDCVMLLEEPGGTSRRVLVPADTAYAREAGVEHNVINGGDRTMRFVEVERKD